MAVHNGEQHLRPALHSLLQQSLKDIELIVVEDGSTDNTLDVLLQFQAADSRIRIISNSENIGLAASLNRGVGEAESEVVARADADDVYAPNRLKRQLDFLTRNPDVAVVGSAVSFIDTAGEPTAQATKKTIPESCDDVRLHSLLGCCLWHTTVMFRKSAIQAVGCYDTQFRGGPEDYDLWSKLLPTRRLVNLPDVLAEVRLHAASVTANWSKGFGMFCSVSRRLIERYLGESVTPESVEALVAMCSYGGDLTKMNHAEGLKLLRRVLAVAASREDRGVYEKFRKKCTSSLIENSSAFVYRDRTLALDMIKTAVSYDPINVFTPRLLTNLVRCFCPNRLRSLIKNPAFSND
jgi:glycosyltransferase involved in cell wall biosynthesis